MVDAPVPRERVETATALSGSARLAAAGPAAEPAGAAVRIGRGRRPEEATEVALEDWSGPLGLLLSLIEARRLDVLIVPLGSVAAAYLEALATLEGDRIANVSAFVAVASQLILIKSRAMLPRPVQSPPPADEADEPPDPEAELRRRLLLYRAYRDAGAALQSAVLGRVGLFRREPGAALRTAAAGAALPAEPPLDPAALVEALGRLALVLPPPEPPPETIRRSVTLADRAAVIRAALRAAPAVVLQELLRGVRDRVVISVTFLAMLELMKRREIVVEQADPFGPITARRTTDTERAAAGLPLDLEARSLEESPGVFR